MTTIDVDATGRRVEALLDVIAATEPAAGTAAEQLVGELVGMYGAALERLLDVLAEAAPDRLATVGADPLLTGLLALHDLHPTALVHRVQAALEEVRPLLEPRGADVVVLGVGADVVRLRLEGITGCGAEGLEQAVQDAVAAGVPDVGHVEVTQATAPSTNGLIHPDTLFVRPVGRLGSVVS
ncbi:MAG: NifU family protein [Egibacteraceae bacterium]